MRGPKSMARGLALFGGVAVVLGGALLGASVASAATPTINLQLVPVGGFPTTGQSAPLVQGTGFAPKTQVWVSECSISTTEPTMSVAVNLKGGTSTNLTMPVGCAVPQSVNTLITKKGVMAPTAVSVEAGAVGPPGGGSDSSGASGATDAANYPCPPFVSQTGTTCAVVVFDQNGTSAQAAITFAGSNSTPDTTAVPVTTTAPCNAINGTATANAPASPAATGAGTATVDQTGGAPPTGRTQAATCVLGGEVVQVAATGLGVGNGGDATIIECNNAPGQATVEFAGHAVPVSCTPITAATLIALTSNNLPSKPFTVVQGVTGPPVVPAAPGLDSAGILATTDAQNYPCPPTPTQQAAGDSCVIAVGTAYLSGPTTSDQLPVPITFNQNKLTQGTTTNNATKAAATAATAKTKSTKTSSSALAFTGAGSGLHVLGYLGLSLVALGLLLLALVDGPKLLLIRVSRAVGRRESQA